MGGVAANAAESRVSPEKTWQSLDSHATALKSLLPGIQGMYVEKTTSTAVLDVFARPEEQDKVLAKLPEVEKLLGVPVRITIIGAPLIQQ